MRSTPVLLTLAATIVVVDQATKAWALVRLAPGTTTPVIDGVLHWTLQRNPGAAFGILSGFPYVFTILAFALTIGVLANLRRVHGLLNGVGFGLVLGGAVGNLVDRIARDPAIFRGHVVDFIDLRVWPVFNIADMGIVVGAFILVVVSWRADRAAKVGSADA